MRFGRWTEWREFLLARLTGSAWWAVLIEFQVKSFDRFPGAAWRSARWLLADRTASCETDWKPTEAGGLKQPREQIEKFYQLIWPAQCGGELTPNSAVVAAVESLETAIGRISTWAPGRSESKFWIQNGFTALWMAERCPSRTVLSTISIITSNELRDPPVSACRRRIRVLCAPDSAVRIL